MPLPQFDYVGALQQGGAVHRSPRPDLQLDQITYLQTGRRYGPVRETIYVFLDDVLA